MAKTNGKGLTHLQRKESNRAKEVLDDAEGICNQLKALWLLNTDKLGPMAEHIEASRCLTMTYNNIGVLYKQDKKENVAIRYLKKVVEIEEKMVNCETQKTDLA